jgi:NADPH2:quinone reductase
VSVSDRDAAAAALVSITAHLGLVDNAALRPGETIFVNGASGGVGSAVVQIARQLGGRVIGSASSGKAARVRELGAEAVVDYTRPDLVDEIRRAAPNGVHVYWETQREPDFDRAVAVLAEGGRMVRMAGRDARPAFPVGPFYVKGCRLFGFVMFKASSQLQAAAATDINRWLSGGRLRVPIDRVLPLAETAAGHALQEAATVGRSGGLTGKIVSTRQLCVPAWA